MWAAIKQRVFTWKFLMWTVLAGIAVGILAIIAFFVWMAALGRTVPSVEKLSEYNPPVTSRVHAGDGTLIYEFADEHRVFIPYEAIPEHVIHAFVSAEDKKFFNMKPSIGSFLHSVYISNRFIASRLRHL